MLRMMVGLIRTKNRTLQEPLGPAARDQPPAAAVRAGGARVGRGRRARGRSDRRERARHERRAGGGESD